MGNLETDRILLRPFRVDDWVDIRNLAIDWKSAPGPEWDKWPTDEKFAKNFAGADPEKYFALHLKNEDKVIGLLALNGINEDGQLDLGHVIHSKYQDNDIDKEALSTIVDYIFDKTESISIVTHNAAENAKQLAPLRSLGFDYPDESDKGTLSISKDDWNGH